ncbi:MAG: DegT/DnrJ/EryC1/StrS family aminotransferase [Chloroflexota bacterium]|jgi:dTDP-4-amino-4,6-dideoxygalactose transaminase
MTPHRNVPFVDLQIQYQELKAEIDAAMQQVLDTSSYILGPAVADFEADFADYCDVSEAIGVDSGYSAVELALRANGIGPGDEVITQANTFIATVLPVLNAGAKPVLVDIHPDNYNLDPSKLEAAITPATRAIVAVHLYGHPADMAPILEIARRHNLVVVEDAAQAHGARYYGHRIGGLGHVAAFSFYPTKNLGAFGDAGAVTTNDPELAEQVRLLRNLGQPVKYVHAQRGFNFRLDSLQAAVLRQKLTRLDSWNAQRQHLARRYDRGLAGLPLVTPTEAPWAEHVYHLYVIRAARRDALQQHLADHGVATALHYPVPLHRQEALQELGYRPGDFPVTERYAQEILSLPMYSGMTEADQDHVIQVIRQFNFGSKPYPAVQPALAASAAD